MKSAAAATRESRVLYEIISTVASSLDLDDVLKSVVRLLSRAADVHACFVYLVDGPRLVLKAAGEPYADLVGEIALERGEGLAWWVAEHREPAFIRESALDDSRVKYVPELEEEKFQSLVSIPILSRDRDPIGVISMHTEAPREFTDDEVDFLVSSASLVAGAIENARLYEESRRRVRELEHLTELGEAVARSDALRDLFPEVAQRACELLRAESCQLYLLDADQLRLQVSVPEDRRARQTLALNELGPELTRRGRKSRVSVPLVANDELLGLLHAFGTVEVDLARAVANLTAVAIKKIDLIDRLSEKNLIRDFFDLLERGGDTAVVEAKASRLGLDLEAEHLVVASMGGGERLEALLRAATPGSVFDRRDDGMRGVLRSPAGGAARLVERVRAAQAELGGDVAIGLSNACRGAASFPAGFGEARNALLGTAVLDKAAIAYDELGPYKYFLRMSLEGVRDAHRDAVARLADYDRERSSSLLRTLEEFLRRRGNISATAEALYVHPNTLRQRLRRIMEISGLDLRKEDWLMVEMAVKLAKLHTPPPSRM